MHCSCGNIRCLCEDSCVCRPSICACEQCKEIRNNHRAQCRTCRGASAALCNQMYGHFRKVYYTGEITPRQTSSTSSNESYSDDSLMFQMDDIDGPLDESTSKSTENKSSILESSDLTSKTSLSDTDQSKMPEMSAKMPEYSQTILEPGESRSSTMPPQQNPDETVLKRAQSPDKEMPSKHVAGCSQHNANSVPQHEQSQINDQTSLTVSQSSDKFSRKSLQSDSSSDDLPPTDFPVSPESSIQVLSRSAPSLYEYHKLSCKLESSKQSIAQNTCPASTGLMQLKTLCISDSQPINKTLSESSSSIETLPPDKSGELSSLIETLPTDKSAKAESPSRHGNSHIAISTRRSILKEQVPLKQRTTSESSSSIEILSKEPSEDEASYFPERK